MCTVALQSLESWNLSLDLSGVLAPTKLYSVGDIPEIRMKSLCVLGGCVLVTPALYELHWLPIQSRIQFKLCLLVHHVIGGRSPPYISELVTPVATIPGRPSLRSVGRQELDVPRTRLVSSERAFEVAAPKAWNKLPVDIKSTRDTVLFKKQLKTFLFRAAYPVSC